MDALRSYYDVTNLPTLAPDDANKELIDIENHATIGGRRDGNLNIDNTGGHRTLTLNGTLYVTGSLTFNGVGTPDYYTIDLNKNTILVGGAITFPSNGVSITGSGCIIAEKSIKFLPGTESSPDDFVLLLSLTEDVTLLPSSGTFYGSIAGPSVESDVSTKVDIVWQPLSEGGIDFPIDMYGYDIVDTATVRTWEVKRE
jgi:hypothetical protein